MSELVASYSFPSQTCSSDSSLWLHPDEVVKNRIMTSLNVSHDYPDLDEILDVGDAGDFVSGGLESASLSVYDGGYIEDLSHLCSENSEITQQHYQTKVKTPSEDFSKHHEEGLLEALHRSMENFESSTMSDLASLSSSLGITHPSDDLSLPVSTGGGFMDSMMMTDQLSTGAGNTTPLQSPEEEEIVSVDEQVDMDEEKSDANESVLRQLLLNPNDNYRKEIDAISNNVEHIEKTLGNVGNSREIQRQSRKMKKKKIPKKPFTELLKHLESSNSTLSHQVCAGTTKHKTRVLNARNYQRQYGSAPVSRVNSPEPEASMTQQKKANSRSGNQKTNSSKNSRSGSSIVPKKPLQVTKIYPISHSSIATLQMDRKTENMIVAPDLNSLLDMFEHESTQNFNFNLSRKETAAFAFRPTNDKRKGTVLIEPLPKKRLRTSQDDSVKKDQPVCQPTGQICHEKPSSDHDYCISSVPSRIGLSSESLSNGDTTRVVQWEEYLQRVRSGTRSAPNSPTNSPKPQRINLRKCTGPQNSISVVHTTSSATNHTQTNTPLTSLKIPPKPTMKLQKFQEYLANLQNKSGSSSMSPSCEIIASTSGALTNTVKVVQAASPLTLNVSSGRPAAQQTKPATLSQSFIQVKSGGKIHTAAVTSSPTGPHQSAPMVVIRIPAQQNAPIINAVTLSQKLPVSFATTRTFVTSGGKQPPTTSSLPASSSAHTSTSSAKKLSVTKSNLSAKISGVSHSTQTADDASNPVSPQTASPTFKLMTSSKGKSLILSNVTGQLKEILTALARQQQQQGSQDESSTSQQQKTLQKLLATITNMKKNQSSTDTVSPMTSCGAVVTASHTMDPSESNNVANTMSYPHTQVSTSNSEVKTAHCNFSTYENCITNKQSDQTLAVPSSALQQKSSSSQHSSNNAEQALQNPVNQYLNSVVKSTVDSLVEQAVENCRRDDAMTVPSEVGKIVNSQLVSVASVNPTTTSCSPAVHTTCSSTKMIYCGSENSENKREIIDSQSSVKETTAVSGDATADEQYYNKLPAYLYSGKLLRKSADEDPNSDESQNVEYNKLPHYFSSGKLAPREDPAVHGSSANFIDVGMEQEISCTPEGAVIDPEDTFYSRLPSYYGYGRTHVVDTVTEPPTHSDEIVTRETLDRDDEKRRRNLAEQAQVVIEQHPQQEKEAVLDNRILYSKIPSYLLSGRQPLASNRSLSEETSSVSNSSDSEGATSSAYRTRSKRLTKSPCHWDYKIRKKKEEEAKNLAIVQRRVMYVGGISEVTSQPYLRSRFQKFGAIDDVTLHYRKGRDNYAFVTFRYSNDVMEAIEHGNDDVVPKYTLCLGGRRQFCKVAYSDLDDEKGRSDEMDKEDDFDTLLREAMRR